MKKHVLAVRGVGGYRQYRIPAMAVTPSGRIIAIYDARADFDDLPGPVDLVIRISDDNGSTWSEQELFRKHEGISGYGDASIIVDPSYGNQGRIIVLHQWTRIAGFFESTLGADLDDPLIAHIARSISDDDGATWRHDVITNQLKDESTPGLFATSGMGGRISTGEFAGRLLQTFVLRRQSELLSAIGYSDDHGETWKLGALIKGGNETAIAGLKDGTVLIHSRATPYRISGRSIDGGDTLTILEPDLALPDPSDNGSLCVLSNGDAICTHNHDMDLRRNTVMKRSTDNGLTWSTAVVIEQDGSAYSTACELADGKVGVLFERDAYNEIVFCKISVDEFKPINEALVEAKHEEGIEITIIPRYILPARERVSEARLTSTPLVPEVDMNKWNSYERKEVGSISGTTSGDSLFTTDELKNILGPVLPGLHENDEIRFSLRIKNHGTQAMENVLLRDRDKQDLFESDSIKPGEKICLLDIRQRISKLDLAESSVRFSFDLSGVFSNSRQKVGQKEFRRTIEVVMTTN